MAANLGEYIHETLYNWIYPVSEGKLIKALIDPVPPYIYIDIDNDSSDYLETGGGQIVDEIIETDFEIWYHTKIASDTKREGKLRKDLNSKIEDIKRVLRYPALPDKFTYTYNNIDQYNCFIINIKITDVSKATHDEGGEGIALIKGKLNYRIIYKVN